MSNGAPYLFARKSHFSQGENGVRGQDVRNWFRAPVNRSHESRRSKAPLRFLIACPIRCSFSMRAKRT